MNLPQGGRDVKSYLDMTNKKIELLKLSGNVGVFRKLMMLIQYDAQSEPPFFVCVRGGKWRYNSAASPPQHSHNVVFVRPRGEVWGK